MKKDSSGRKMKSRFKVHRFDIRMTTDQYRVEEFLNSLEGEVVAVFPNVTSTQLQYASVDFLFIVEKLQ